MKRKVIDLKFPIYFSRKIATAKDTKNNLSRVIVFIGRLSVALGIIVSLITVSTGLGSKKAIKSSLSDFSGEITIKSNRSNSSYNSTVLEQEGLKLNQIKNLPQVRNVQSFVNTNGILRTEDNFAGIIFKGVGDDFQRDNFKKFLVSGDVPKFSDKEVTNDVLLSQKIANDLHKKLNDSVVAIFSKENEKPVYRKFKIAGIYKTDIKMLDDLYVIGGIKHARRIQGFEDKQVGGLEVYLKDVEDIDSAFPQIENLIGYKNYAEKITDRFPQIVDWINLFDTNIGLIIAIMLLVVVINIIMVLLILIIERTNSIGLLKTMGATNQQIRAIFINYTVIIMIPGLIAGNVIGIGLLLIQQFFGVISLNPENYYVSKVPVDLNPVYIIGISAGILLVSAISLILPSYLISKISPVKSIKYS